MQEDIINGYDSSEVGFYAGIFSTMATAYSLDKNSIPMQAKLRVSYVGDSAIVNLPVIKQWEASFPLNMIEEHLAALKSLTALKIDWGRNEQFAHIPATAVQFNMETGAAPESFVPQQPCVIAATDVNYSTGIIAGKNVLYVLLRRIGNMQILKVDYKTKAIALLPIIKKGAIAEMSLYGENDLVFGSGSAIAGRQYMHYNYQKNIIEAVPFAAKAYDAGESLATEVIFIPSRDGKKIPVSLLYKKGLNLKNFNPILIDGYGNSGSSNDMFYDPSYLPFINRGGIYAYAHVRGGGELGEEWIKDGQFPNKINGINDVMDVAEHFVKNNYTSPAKQLIMGTSAGSFLVCMAINQRPDLFAAGLFLSGLPDIVTYRDAAFARESKTVGPIGTKGGFLSSYSISSYYQIPQHKKLPAMLIVHGATDYILDMHPAVRYTAKLQQAQKGDRPILLLVDWQSGHSGSEYELLYMLKFALWQTGHPHFQPKNN